MHFRDIRDILANVLMLWFFATPIIYPWFQPNVQRFKWLFDLNPFTHLAVSYQEILFFDGPIGHWRWLLALGVGSVVLFLAGYWLFDRLRDSFAEVGMTPAIELVNVSKIYRRYGGRQFATLKSALLQRSILRDLQPSETFPALTDVSFTVPKGSTYGVIGRNGSGQEHGAEAGRRHHQADERDGAGRGPHLGAHRARRRLPSRDLRPRERLHQRHHARPHQARDPASASTRSSSSPSSASSSTRRSRPTRPACTCASALPSRSTSIPTCCWSTKCSRSATKGFTHKCLDKFAEFRRRGKTILLVTHSLGLVERFCDEALWLDDGPRAQRTAIPKRVVGAYLTAVEEGEAAAAGDDDGEGRRGRGASSRRDAARTAVPPTRRRPNMFQAAEGRWGSREVEITDVALLDAQGEPSFVFHTGEPMSVRLKVRAHASDRRLRLRHQPVQRRRRLLLRHQHLPRGDGPGAAERRGRRRRLRSTAWIWSKAPTSWTSRCTSATAFPTTITACCIPSA